MRGDPLHDSVLLCDLAIFEWTLCDFLIQIGSVHFPLHPTWKWDLEDVCIAGIITSKEQEGDKKKTWGSKGIEKEVRRGRGGRESEREIGEKKQIPEAEP